MSGPVTQSKIRTPEDILSPPVLPTVAIFDFVCPFDHRMMPGKFCDDISNDSVVFMLTDKQKSQTDPAENNTTVTAWVVNRYWWSII